MGQHGVRQLTHAGREAGPRRAGLRVGPRRAGQAGERGPDDVMVGVHGVQESRRGRGTAADQRVQALVLGLVMTVLEVGQLARQDLCSLVNPRIGHSPL